MVNRMGNDKLTNSRSHIHNCERRTMLCKIDFDRDRDYISLSISGALNMAEARACRSKLQEFLRICNRTSVLIDTTNVIAKLLTVEDYQFIKEIGDEFSSTVSMAVILSRDRGQFGRFIEITAANNGVSLRTFTEKDEAVSWLIKQN